MTELNPNHPVSEGLHDHWHKICALLLLRLGLKPGSGEIVITEQDAKAMAELGTATILAHERHDGLHLSLVDEKDREKWLKRSVH